MLWMLPFTAGHCDSTTKKYSWNNGIKDGRKETIKLDPHVFGQFFINQFDYNAGDIRLF